MPFLHLSNDSQGNLARVARKAIPLFAHDLNGRATRTVLI